MKSEEQMYAECVTIYQTSKNPVMDIFTYAEINHLNARAYCEGCEIETPVLSDGSCLVCGS